MKNFLSVLFYQVHSLKVDSSIYWSKRSGISIVNNIMHILFNQGWHIMILFRIGKIIYAFPIPIISHLLKIIFQIIWFFFTTFYGIFIDLSSNIGKGFYIGHYGGIFIGGNIGDFCSVGQCVTVGYKGAGQSDHWPTIQNNVYIGVGAKVIGDIAIGENTIIGANAVVLRSLPSGALAVGVPAKNIREKKSD